MICVSGSGDKVGFSALMSETITSLHMVDIEGSQCFLIYIYKIADEPDAGAQGRLFAAGVEVSGRFSRQMASQMTDSLFFRLRILKRQSARTTYSTTHTQCFTRRIIESDLWTIFRKNCHGYPS